MVSGWWFIPATSHRPEIHILEISKKAVTPKSPLFYKANTKQKEENNVLAARQPIGCVIPIKLFFELRRGGVFINEQVFNARHFGKIFHVL